MEVFRPYLDAVHRMAGITDGSCGGGGRNGGGGAAVGPPVQCRGIVVHLCEAGASMEVTREVSLAFYRSPREYILSVSLCLPPCAGGAQLVPCCAKVLLVMCCARGLFVSRRMFLWEV